MMGYLEKTSFQGRPFNFSWPTLVISDLSLAYSAMRRIL